MEAVVFRCLCAAATDVPNREPSTSADDRGGGVCLNLTGVGRYQLAFSVEGVPKVERLDSTDEANSIMSGTITTDVHTLFKLANKSLSPLRAMTSGQVKFEASKSSSGSRNRVDNRRVLGPWIPALKRAGLEIQGAVENSLQHAGEITARVTSKSVDEAAQRSRKTEAVRYVVTVVVRNEHILSALSSDAPRKNSDLRWEFEKSYSDFCKLRKQLASSKDLEQVEAVAPFPKIRDKSFKAMTLTRSSKVNSQQGLLDAWTRAVAVLKPLPETVAEFLEISNNVVDADEVKSEDNGDLSPSGVERILKVLPTFDVQGFEGRTHLISRLSTLESQVKALTKLGSKGWHSFLYQLLSCVPTFAPMVFATVAANELLRCFSPVAANNDDSNQFTNYQLVLSVGILAIQSKKCAGVTVSLSALSQLRDWDAVNTSVVANYAAFTTSRVLPLIFTFLFGRVIRYLWTECGFRRAARIYAAASVVIGLYTSTKLLFKVLRFDAQQTAPLYEQLDTFLAPFVAGQFVALKSVWVKIGQYISGRADVTPALWQEAFAVMQSDMPNDNVNEIDATFREAFPGKKIADVFEEFDYVPLASASIAQVHKARLVNGKPVAVKIQHAGVANVFLDDMARSIKIARVCAWLNSDFETTLTVLTSWEREIHLELDFEHEVANIRSMRTALLDKYGANVCVPAVIDSLVSKRVFAMEFIENSFKIDDVFQLSLHGVKKVELMHLIVHVWSIMLFRINAVNADPHPGNLHVRLSTDGTVQPVLLDWGWVVRLPASELKGWQELVVALSDMDVARASKALQALGYRNNQDNRVPERSVEFFAYLMRDTSSAKQAKKETKEYFEAKKTEREADKEKGVREKGGRKIQELPESFIFVIRVIGLLRGLCTTLEVEIPLIEIMASHARLGQVESQEVYAGSKIT